MNQGKWKKFSPSSISERSKKTLNYGCKINSLSLFYFIFIFTHSAFLFCSLFFTGVLILVIGYTIAGTIIFVSLEGDAEEMDGAETAASKPYPRNDMYYAELRTR